MVLSAVIAAGIVGMIGVDHATMALAIGLVVGVGPVLLVWMTNRQALDNLPRWVPWVWVALILVSDLRFDTRGPLDVASGDVGIQHVIQLLVYGGVAAVVLRFRGAMLSLYPSAVPKGLLIAWPVLALASSLWSLIPLYTAVRAVQLLVLVAFTLFVVRIWVSDPSTGERVWVGIMRLFVQTATVLTLVGFILHPWTSEASEAAGRFTWPGAHPGTAATYVGAAFVILLAGGRSMIGFSRLGYWARLLLFGAAIYLGQTRSVIGAVLVATAGALWFLGREKPQARFLGLPYFFVGIALLIALAAQQVVTYLSRGAPIESIATLDSRVPLWEFAIGQFHSLGQWLGGFGYGATRVLLLPEFYWAGSAHSTWIEALLGIGIVGVILVAADLLVLGIRLARRQPSVSLNRVGIALLGFMIVLSLISEVLVLPGLGFGLVALLHVPALAQRAFEASPAAGRWRPILSPPRKSSM